MMNSLEISRSFLPLKQEDVYFSNLFVTLTDADGGLVEATEVSDDTGVPIAYDTGFYGTEQASLFFSLDYLEVLDVNKLIPPFIKKNKYKIFISYYLRKTRLIDNI